jgi:hypothetical protein
MRQSRRNDASEMLEALDDIACDIGDSLHLEHMTDKVHSPHCILHRLLTQCGSVSRWRARLAATVDSFSYLCGSELHALAYREVRPIWACVASAGLGVAWQSLSHVEYETRLVRTPCTYFDASYESQGSLAFELLERLRQVVCVYMDDRSHHIIE